MTFFFFCVSVFHPSVWSDVSGKIVKNLYCRILIISSKEEKSVVVVFETASLNDNMMRLFVKKLNTLRRKNVADQGN